MSRRLDRCIDAGLEQLVDVGALSDLVIETHIVGADGRIVSDWDVHLVFDCTDSW
jgi:hypothetical protein